MTKRIEDYGLIGDGRTAALVSRHGAIDWLCWPRFDSDACFAALLGNENHGSWSLSPQAKIVSQARRYQTDTLILETDFETAEGVVRVIDFMPPEATHSSIVRLVIGLRGRVPMCGLVRLRFDYGHMTAWTELRDDGFTACIGPDRIRLWASVPVHPAAEYTIAEFVIAAGERQYFVLSYANACEPEIEALDIDGALSRTGNYWRQWIGKFDKRVAWPEAMRRSLLTLRALIYRPTGGIVAAPTTSLPEKFGGQKNWDYRYCWLRDATFSLKALLRAGFHEEAAAWREWILRALGAEPDKLKIMYRVDGGRHLDEWLIDWLPGYEGAQPVRVGNKAIDQRQVDVYGELISAMEFATRCGIPQSEHGQSLECRLVEHLVAIWREPGQGLWESRGEPRHYTYSKVMAWVGIDRFVKSAERHGHADAKTIARLRKLRAEIKEEVCREGYNAAAGTFVQHYGGQELDASLLLLPIVGFISATDPRMARTINAIERELTRHGLVMRQLPNGARTEGAFLACTCWLADCQRLQGRVDDAKASLERVLGVANDLGLLSEEFDPVELRLSGNFPQALSHLAVVNTIHGLSDDRS